jgi:hypothetical protein
VRIKPEAAQGESVCTWVTDASPACSALPD